MAAMPTTPLVATSSLADLNDEEDEEDDEEEMLEVPEEVVEIEDPYARLSKRAESVRYMTNPLAGLSVRSREVAASSWASLLLCPSNVPSLCPRCACGPLPVLLSAPLAQAAAVAPPTTPTAGGAGVPRRTSALLGGLSGVVVELSDDEADGGDDDDDEDDGGGGGGGGEDAGAAGGAAAPLSTIASKGRERAGSTTDLRNRVADAAPADVMKGVLGGLAAAAKDRSDEFMARLEAQVHWGSVVAAGRPSGSDVGGAPPLAKWAAACDGAWPRPTCHAVDTSTIMVDWGARARVGGGGGEHRRPRSASGWN